jgi:hypothetical protein
MQVLGRQYQFARLLKQGKFTFTSKVGQTVNERIRSRVQVAEEISQAQSADVFKQKLTQNQIEYVDLLYDAIVKNMSHTQAEKFFQYSMNRALDTIDPAEVFFNGFSAKSSEITDDLDPVDQFYRTHIQAQSVYKEALSGLDLSNVGKATEAKVEAKVDLEQQKKDAEADAKKAEEEKKVNLEEQKV